MNEWAEGFGNEYLKRNRVNWQARIPFWQYIISTTGARSVYERGCNAGWNLSAIKRCYPDVQLHGQEINKTAIAQARMAGLNVSDEVGNEKVDLTFTAGVLIHIPSEDLKEFMQSMIDASSDYVLAIEYDSEKEEKVEYRDNVGLWRRPYGKLYEDMGLKLIESKYSIEGFDDVTFWLMRK